MLSSLGIESINDVLFWVLWYMLMWSAYILLFNKGVPNIRTAPAIRKAIIEILKKDREAKGGGAYMIVDLGSGNGLFTRQIARAMPEAQVVGVEICNIAYGWAETMRKFSGLKNLSYRKTDFNSFDLGQADAIVLYLTIYDMEPIGAKLNRELKKGALATSNRFRLGDGWVPSEVIDVKTLYPHQKTFHVYYK